VNELQETSHHAEANAAIPERERAGSGGERGKENERRKRRVKLYFRP